METKDLGQLGGGEKLTLGSLSGNTTPGNTGRGTSKIGVSHTSNVLTFTTDIHLLHEPKGFLDGRAREQSAMPSGEMGVVFLEVEVEGKEMVDGVFVVLDEGEIGDGAFASSEPEIQNFRQFIETIVKG